jgi:hypothetical protein
VWVLRRRSRELVEDEKEVDGMWSLRDLGLD